MHTKLIHAHRSLLACMTLAITSCASRPHTELSALNWHPQLDQPAKQLTDLLAAQDQQQQMNYTSANLAAVLDAELYLLFESYYRRLPDARCERDMEDQRQWLEKRKAATDKAAERYKGGTLAPLAANQAFIDMTQARIDEINRLLLPLVAK